jgi:hypothetical protein
MVRIHPSCRKGKTDERAVAAAQYTPPPNLPACATELLQACFARDPGARWSSAAIDDLGFTPDAAPDSIPASGLNSVSASTTGTRAASPATRPGSKPAVSRAISEHGTRANGSPARPPVFMDLGNALENERSPSRVRRRSLRAGMPSYPSTLSPDGTTDDAESLSRSQSPSGSVLPRTPSASPLAPRRARRPESATRADGTSRSRSIEHPLLRRPRGSSKSRAGKALFGLGGGLEPSPEGDERTAAVHEEGEGEEEERDWVDRHGLPSVGVSQEMAQGRTAQARTGGGGGIGPGRVGASVPPVMKGKEGQTFLVGVREEPEVVGSSAGGRQRSATQVGPGAMRGRAVVS